MVATLVKLRFLLLFNVIRKSVWQIIAVVFGALYGLGVITGIVAGLIGLSFAPVEVARTAIVLGGAAMIIGWTVLPLLTAGIDQTVDPARLAPFPIPLGTLVVGLTVSGVLGIPGIVSLLVALATAATWWRFPLAAAASLVCAVIGVLTAVVGSRMLVAVSSGAAVSRGTREARNVLVVLLLISIGPIVLGIGQLLSTLSDVLPTVARVLAWTPFGAIWAVPGDIAAGDPGRAAIEFAIGVATLALFVVLWRWGLATSLETPARSAPVRLGKRGLGLFGVFPSTPAGAVAARSLTYWYRDPRYSQSLISIPLIPVVIFFAAGAGGNVAALNAIGPILALLLAISIYTDVSYDNTAFALHLQTGVRGRDDRLGRVAALSVFAAPTTLVATVASVAYTGSWQFLPALLGISIGVLLSGFGVSSVVSGRFAFAVPAPGESPFKSKPGGGFGLLVSTMATWTVLSVLALPEFVFAALNFITSDPLWGWLALAAGIAFGSLFAVVGIRLGGSILDRYGPNLLVQLQRQK